VPAPFALALGDGLGARFFSAVNRMLLRLSASLFAFQVLLVIHPRPTLAYLLERARQASGDRIASRAG
jgi:hypothetical protein